MARDYYNHPQHHMIRLALFAYVLFLFHRYSPKASPLLDKFKTPDLRA